MRDTAPLVMDKHGKQSKQSAKAGRQQRQMRRHIGPPIAVAFWIKRGFQQPPGDAAAEQQRAERGLQLDCRRSDIGKNDNRQRGAEACARKMPDANHCGRQTAEDAGNEKAAQEKRIGSSNNQRSAMIFPYAFDRQAPPSRLGGVVLQSKAPSPCLHLVLVTDGLQATQDRPDSHLENAAFEGE